MAEMLSRMKNLLIDVLLEKSLPDASKIKLKDCISMIETFSSFLSKNSKKETKGGGEKSELPMSLANKLKTSKSASDISTVSWLNGEDEQVDINNLKENCLQAIKELSNNPEINAELDTKLNDIKSEVIVDDSVKKSNTDINSTKTVLINENTEQNHSKPDMNDVKLGLGEMKQGVNGTGQEVVRRDQKVPKPRRKRDSSTLFDISLDDVTEPDHSGFLTEKHSGKEWWCVLQDQHLCMFPSQNPQELAYDVLLVPCCEISLDDVYTESPVFRLTQVGSTPWVFSAGIERNLRAWIRALYRACGRDDADWSMRSSKKGRGRKDKKQKRNMKVLTSTIDESEEAEETEEYAQETEKDETEQKKTEHVVEQKSETKEEPSNSKDNCGGKKNFEEKDLAKVAGLKNSVMNQLDKYAESEKREEKAQIEYSSEANKQPVASDSFPKSEREEEHLGDGNFTDEKCLGKQGSINENGNQTTCSANISFGGDDDHSDYVISLQEAGKTDVQQSESSETPKTRNLERKATKKRIKMLRWLKKAFVAKGHDDATVIGDIYKIESPDKHVKLWCLLRDRQLYGYHHVSDTTPVCKIPLDNCIAVPRTTVPGKKYAFDIEREGVKLATFAAQTAKEQSRWIDIVKNRRGTIRLREIADDSEEEAEESGTSEEEDEGYEYVKVDDIIQPANKSNTNFETTGEYVLPMSEDTKYEDAGYISVIALESEVDRRKSYKMQRKYNPNITSKCGIEHLKEKDSPLLISTIPRESQGQRKNRSPAPLPRDSGLFLGKPKTEISKGFPTIQVDVGVEMEPGNETDERLENSMDLNNNTNVEFLEQITPDDEELSSNDEGIFHCQMTASSWLADSPPSQARFGPRSGRNIGAWRPETNDKTQFLEIDIGDFITVGAIGVKGRPDFDEKGGEFIKSFTVHYSIDKETWIPYKSHGKVKVFQGISNANQECKKYFKSKTTAQYFRVYPQSWQNHIALQVALYKVDIGSNALKKGGDKLTQPSPTRKPLLKKKDISDPMHPSSDCLRTELTEPSNFLENGRKSPNNVDCLENPASMESRLKLKEKLLMKEKREQITKLEVLTRHVDQAKDKMIVNPSGQLRREAIETEHDYLVANLELVKAKKRLIDIETEIRELRVFEANYCGEKQDEQETHESQDDCSAQTADEPQAACEDVEQGGDEVQEDQGLREIQVSNEVDLPIVKPRPAKPLKRRPSKEVMVYTDAVSPEVDPEGFNPSGDPPPPRKVLDNVKLFEKFQNQPR